MRYRLPSLNALRDFEAVGRHGSISAAARELCVSAGAVSRQVSLLEKHFRCRLFKRTPSGLTLTHRGEQYFEAITEAFANIDAASRRIVGRRSTPTLTAHIYSTVATEWLVGRLPDFRARHPKIKFRFNAHGRSVDFDVDEVDVGFLLGPQRRPDLHQDVLYRLSFTPMCSPALLERGPPLRAPRDLRRHTLLYSTLEVEPWSAWLLEAGVKGVDLEQGMHFENASLAYQAARDGAGVVLGQPLLLAHHLAEGHLVAPFDITVQGAQSVCLACPRRRMSEPSIVAFRRWLIAEVDSVEANASALIGAAPTQRSGEVHAV